MQVAAVAVCAAVFPGGRLPTVAELEAIEIGRPVVLNGRTFEVCAPMVDQSTFAAFDGETFASDGCVDLLLGVTKPNCTPNQFAGTLCTQ